MNRLLTGTAFIAGMAIAGPALAVTPGAPQPLGGPYVAETAPSPPSTIYPGYAYRPYRDYYGGHYPYWGYRDRYGY